MKGNESWILKDFVFMAILVLGKTTWVVRVDIFSIVLFLLVIAARSHHVHHLDWINWSLLNIISWMSCKLNE